MIVVDASAAVLALVNAGEARRALQAEELHAPALVDSEVLQVFRRRERMATMSPRQVARVVAAWRQIGVRRHAADASIGRIWALRHNLTAYDATYVALAEALGCGLVTADRRLAAAPKLGCPVVVVAS